MADVSQIILKDINGNVIGTYNVKDTSVPHDSKTAQSGGTTLSLVTTGEKATWNAKSDTDTTYTFANGTNGFTVTPSRGSAKTVTVTPSITNNVTGSGTSGRIAKFNAANTITNGPAFGSSTTTYLRNDGSWATPAQPTVGNGTITIQLNGTSKGSFTTNQSGNGTININGVQTTLSTIDNSVSLSVHGNFQSTTKKLFTYGNVVEIFISANLKYALADNAILFTVSNTYKPKVNDSGFTFFTGTDPYVPTGMKFGYFGWGSNEFHALGALSAGTQVTVHILYLI